MRPVRGPLLGRQRGGAASETRYGSDDAAASAGSDDVMLRCHMATVLRRCAGFVGRAAAVTWRRACVDTDHMSAHTHIHTPIHTAGPADGNDVTGG